MSAVQLMHASGRPGMARRGAGVVRTPSPTCLGAAGAPRWAGGSGCLQPGNATWCGDRGCPLAATRSGVSRPHAASRMPHARQVRRCAGTPAGRSTCRAPSPATKQRSLEMRTRQQPEESKGGPARANRPPDAALTTQAGRDRLEDDVRLGLDAGRRALDDLDLVRLDERDRLHLVGHGSDRHSVCCWRCCLLAVVVVGGKAPAPPGRRHL